MSLKRSELLYDKYSCGPSCCCAYSCFKKKSFLQNSYFSTLFSHAYQEFTFFECFFFQTKLLLTCMYVAWFFLTNYQKNKKRQKYQL